MRHDLENKLEIKAYDIYGLTEIEGPGVSFECEMQDGMHICEDLFLPEIVDPDTLEPVPDGRARAIAAGTCKLGKPKGSGIKTREQMETEYRAVIKNLKAGQSIRNTAKITGVSTFTVQKVKREFNL